MNAQASLRNQLLLLIGIPLLIVLVVEGVFSYRMSLNTANVVFDRWLFDSAFSLAQEVQMKSGEVFFVADSTAIEVFEWDDIDQVYFQVATPENTVIAGASDLPPPLDVERLRDGPVYEDAELDGEPLRIVRVLGYADSEHPVIISVAETLNKRREMTTDVLVKVLISNGGLLVLALLAVGIAVDRGLRPLRRLSYELGNRSPQDLTPINVGRLPHEFLGLVESTNGLLARIDSAISAREQFIGNIVHQIRTPLAGIKLHAQLAEADTELGDIHEALTEISNTVDHMAHVNSQLLKLARAEVAYGRGLRRVPLDLVKLVQNCCENLADGVLARHIRLNLQTPDHPVYVLGEAVLLAEMVSNLIDNSIIYGRNGGHVWVDIREGDGTIDLVVEDDGPGIPQEHWPRIFERFFRPPQSTGEGCGLGLPIVREIALAHDASIFIEESKASTGTRFIVRFDLSKCGVTATS